MRYAKTKSDGFLGIVKKYKVWVITHLKAKRCFYLNNLANASSYEYKMTTKLPVKSFLKKINSRKKNHNKKNN